MVTPVSIVLRATTRDHIIMESVDAVLLYFSVLYENVMQSWQIHGHWVTGSLAVVTVSFWMATDCDPRHSSKSGVYWNDHPLLQFK